MNFEQFLEKYLVKNISDLEKSLEQFKVSVIKSHDEKDDTYILLSQDGGSTYESRMMDGCIISKDCKLVSYIPYQRKSVIDSSLITNNLQQKVEVEELVDGTVVRLYYHKKWIVATARTIDAKDKKWLSEKTFHDLFLECSKNKINYQTIDKKYTYVFVIMHPENKNVVQYTEPGILHINTYEGMKEMSVDIGLNKPRRFVFNSLMEMGRYCQSLMWVNPGFLFLDPTTGEKTKCISSLYELVRKLKGNTVNIKKHLLYLRQEYYRSKLFDMANFLLFFPEYTDILTDLETTIKTKSEEMLYKYRAIKINKEFFELTPIEKRLLFTLHSKFLETKKPVTLEDVKEIVNKLSVTKCFEFIN